VGELEPQLGSLGAEVGGLNARVKDLEQQLAHTQKEQTALVKDRDDQKRRASDLEAQLGKLNKERDDYKWRVGELEPQIKTQQSKLSVYEAQLHRLQGDSQGHQARAKALESELALLRRSQEIERAETQVKLATLEKAAKAKPRSTKKDDLTIIEGIGPKINAALVAAGIDTFEELESASEAQLRGILKAAGLTFAPSIVTWSRQASFLTRGDKKGFEAYTERLVAGRDPDKA
jgi:predicted flap endonuclease-1-like 5' DNA nuclease